MAPAYAKFDASPDIELAGRKPCVSVGTLDDSLTLSDRDEGLLKHEEAASAVTVQKSVSHRVKKAIAISGSASTSSVSPEKVPERRCSERLRTLFANGRPSYFPTRKSDFSSETCEGSGNLENSGKSVQDNKHVAESLAGPLDPSSVVSNDNAEALDSKKKRSRPVARKHTIVVNRTAKGSKVPISIERKRLRSATATVSEQIQKNILKKDMEAQKIEMAKRDIEILDSDVTGEIQNMPHEETEARNKVLATRRIFNNYFLEALKQEKERCEGKQQRTNEGNAKDTNEKRTSRRPDLKACKKMRVKNEILYSKRIGGLPGIYVGDHFNSRAEIKALGLHSYTLGGIDFIPQNSKDPEHQHLKLPLAVAIVLSGQYEDDVDNSDCIEYTGQGHNNLLGDKKQMGHQKLTRGNLSLVNSKELGTSVRVIRGHPSSDTISGKIYTYDGLYKVTSYRLLKGASGFDVWKFRLERETNQPALTTNQVYFSRGQIPAHPSVSQGLVCEDISNGKENIPIFATNTIDDPPVGPTGFRYLKSCEVADGIDIPPLVKGCNCKGQCTNRRTCSCAQLNGGDFPYTKNGRLPEPMDVVYECGPNCTCGPDCMNRTSQKGLHYHLEVFRTQNKGWGVRSWDYIPFGAPVCEYTGIIKRADEDNPPEFDDDYIFDIDCVQTTMGIDGRQRRHAGVLKYKIHDLEQQHGQEGRGESQAEFCIDAGPAGGVARFINHSCDPNLYVQCVLNSHHDPRLARIMLFAYNDINPLEELSYDYAMALDSVVDENGMIKQRECLCGGPSCRKRLY
eukprot:TRINITY_DN31019_c0_g1_i1.p1 TRINITY_DN31019_c0_g1~~TRINITY_DN31019_c0_g1_i1.p1  ORF type:complete len:794 (-),score=134.61 TRINITY_DN31019_c0_g1_i1:178-2559(-)